MSKRTGPPMYLSEGAKLAAAETAAEHSAGTAMLRAPLAGDERPAPP